jgi:hypothetical protein
MGCFDITCAVSGIGIGGGDPIRFLLLTENPHYDGRYVCQTDGRWMPRTIPIKGHYDEYGRIENWEESPVQASIMKGFQTDLVEMDEVRRSMDFSSMLEGLWEGRIRVRSPYKGDGSKRDLLVKYAMIREDVWQAMIGMKLHDQYGDDVLTIEDYYKGVAAYVTETDPVRARLKAAAEAAEPGLLKALAESQLYRFEYDPDFYIGIEAAIHKGEEPTHTRRLMNLPGARFLISSFEMTRSGWSKHVSLIRNENNNDDAAFYKTIAEFAFISDILDTVRYTWRPSDTSGPQNSHYKMHLEYLEAMTKVAKKIKKEKVRRRKL